MRSKTPASRLVQTAIRLTLLLGLCAPSAHIAAAELPWPDKNGPSFNGRVPDEEAQGLPVEWDQESGKNIAWKIPLEGRGHSTPVIGHGRAWLTAATEDGKQQFIYCIDTKTGEVLHHKLLFENAEPEPLGNAVNTYASPSCVLEDDAVYVHFGTYGTARLDPETADVVWQRRDINCRHFRGPGSSPIVFDNLLILTFDGIDRQFLTALDKTTGETVWHTDRSTDFHDLDPDGKPIGDGDYRKAYSTPSIIEVNGQPQLISVGSRAAFGYDPRTGREIWTVEHADYNAAARPLAYKNLVIFTTGHGGLLAVRLDDSTKGNVTQSHVAWSRPRGSGRLPNPVLVEDRLFMVTDNGVLYCLDAATGEEKWAKRLGGDYVGSPIVAGGLIYLADEQGRVTVVRPGEQFEMVARNIMEEGMRASPAVADGGLYLRTFGHLVKVAAAAGK